MGKNKAKGLKPANVFHIANKKILKAKSKTKPVVTNLKKINIVNGEKVHKIDKAFTEIQKNVKVLSKTVPSDSTKKRLIPKSQEDKQVNVDAAASLFSQL
ncbi:ribosomal biogenesis factor [Erythrolamprus reginae]|uniref:ribosomal biogenesis factor n=1 Tax=Erythrolamprus reginae TaxID=121349 RepID=UPI00396CCBD6